MIKKEQGQMSFYSHIYEEVIPLDYFLRKLQKAVEVSPGNAYDGKYLEAVITGEPETVTADKAYDSDDNHRHLQKNKIRDALIRKYNREYGLTINMAYGHEQRERPKVERRVADQKKNHGLGKCRYWGLVRMKIQCYMTALVCNCKRIVVLLKQNEEIELAMA